MFPKAAASGLRRQIEISRHYHEEDLATGFGSVELPHAFERKSPQAAFDFRWKYVFPVAGWSEGKFRSGLSSAYHETCDSSYLPSLVRIPSDRGGL